jgi:asparagine N-glycosylation enzyme membrane subunit Stt3
MNNLINNPTSIYLLSLGRRVFLHYLLFTSSRFVNILFGFMIGYSAWQHYGKWYVRYIHLPSLIIQLVLLIYLLSKKRLDKFQYIFISIMLVCLFILKHTKAIKSSWFLFS